jgi:2-C-methyl-D-erythritol 4-phosphate cytidylyltransferase
VLPKEDFDYWRRLCDSHNFALPHELVPGGESRFQSVKKGHGCRNCAYKDNTGIKNKSGAKPLKHEIAETVMIKAGTKQKALSLLHNASTIVIEKPHQLRLK